MNRYSSLIFRNTKNGTNRKVVLTREITEFLKDIISKNTLSDYVFSHLNGEKLKSFDAMFRKVCNRAEIENLRLHDLRHTFCTRMANEGVNPFTIMQIVGHENVETAKRYNNPSDEHLLIVLEKISSRQISRHITEDSKEKGLPVGCIS